MIPRIDWASWTLPVGIAPISFGEAYTQTRLNQAVSLSPDPIAAIIAAADFDEKPGKNTYRHRLSRIGGGCDIFSSPDRDDMLVELSGVGCAMIRDDDVMAATVGDLSDRLSRLDLAADIECDTDPFVFAHRRSYNRVRRIKTDLSDTGSWVQLGSRSSDHFAVIYRYFPPHPRAPYLRTEIRFRRDQARTCAQQVAIRGVRDAVIAANNFYGWQHESWTSLDLHDDQLSGWQPDRGSPDSLRWVLTQVMPALKRMEREGTIDNLASFFETHLSNREDN